MDRMVVVFILLIEAASIVMAVALLSHHGSSPWVVVGTVGALLLLPLILAVSRVRVRLKDDRLRWSFFPFWAGSIPYADVAAAGSVDVNPLPDFGGWGVKWSSSKLGFRLLDELGIDEDDSAEPVPLNVFGAVARGGPHLAIIRTGGKRPVVLSVEEPDAMAAELLRRSLRASR
jgi:hypothetical protein